MEYKIPGIKGSSVSRNENEIIITIDSDRLVYPIDKLITLTINGVECKQEAQWFYLLGKYGIKMPEGYESNINKIRFYRRHRKVVKDELFGYNIVFSYPIYVEDNPNFKVIARFPSYGIDIHGNILDLNTKKIIPHNLGIKEGRYILRNLRTSNGTSTACLHILVASAWLDNDDYKHKCVVDHIDGNKTNPNLSNLRWVTSADNNKYTTLQDVRSDSNKCLLRNIMTGRILKFNSMTHAVNFLGKSRITSTTSPISRKRKHIIVADSGVYEIKMEGDKTPWATKEELSKNEAYYDTYELIVIIDNKRYAFDNVGDINKFLNKKKISGSVPELSKEIKEKYPDANITLEVKRTTIPPGVIARNSNTGEILYGIKPKILFQICNVSETSGRKSIHNNGSYEYNNWSFKYDDGKDFTPLTVINNKRTDVVVIDKVTKEKMLFKSIREAARFLNCDKKTVSRSINNGRYIHNRYIAKLAL